MTGNSNAYKFLVSLLARRCNSFYELPRKTARRTARTSQGTIYQVSMQTGERLYRVDFRTAFDSRLRIRVLERLSRNFSKGFGYTEAYYRPMREQSLAWWQDVSPSYGQMASPEPTSSILNCLLFSWPTHRNG